MDPEGGKGAETRQVELADAFTRLDNVYGQLVETGERAARAEVRVELLTRQLTEAQPELDRRLSVRRVHVHVHVHVHNSPAMTTTLAVTAFKGGAGKTTVTVNLAGALVARERRVLVVDADPQGAAGAALSADDSKPTLYEVLHRAVAGEEAVRASRVPGLDVLVCDLDLTAVEVDLAGQHGRLAEVLRPVRDRYDVVLIDSGPGLAGLPAMAMAAADTLLLVVRPGFLDARALRQALLTAERARRPVLGVVVNGLARHTLHQADVLADVDALLGPARLTTTIPHRVALADAALAGEPVSSYAPAGDAAAAFTALAEEVERRAAAA